MTFKIWWVWFSMSAIFFVGEVFTQGFFIACFGVGAIVAGIVALLNLHMVWQWAAFVIVSAITFAATRRLAEKITKKQPPGIGADRFVGKIGVALETINNIENTGRVRIDKEEWRADSVSDKLIIQAGAKVKVVKMEGTHVVVEEYKEGEEK
jgi:membrane protein implicated in regulation of membrane protease activity